MKNSNLITKKSGFTIIELLVVIVIIGILTAITIVSYIGITGKAVNSTLQSDLTNAKGDILLYQAEKGIYPTNVNDCPTPSSTSNLCFKYSSGNSYYSYSVDNASSPKTFTLAYKNGSTYYKITNDTAPVAFISTPTPATQGPLSPGIVVDDSSVGTIVWTNPNNVKVSDNVYATTPTYPVGTGFKTSHYLKVTNFGFSIPNGATINGIVVEVEKKRDVANSYDAIDSRISLVKADGTISATNRGLTSTSWPSSDGYITYGSSSDLWGETWDDTKINDVDFGAVISVVEHDHNTCLDENSLISTVNGLRKIKELKIGDEVLSFNEKDKSIETKKIINLLSIPISSANNRYYYIHSNGKVIKATENHKFYVNGTYLRADELNVGDKLLSIDLKEFPIEKIEIIENASDLVWDLTVEDNHNFFVEGILVHNSNAYLDHIRMTVYYTTS